MSLFSLNFFISKTLDIFHKNMLTCVGFIIILKLVNILHVSILFSNMVNMDRYN